MTYDQLEKKATEAYHANYPKGGLAMIDPTMIVVIIETIMSLLAGCQTAKQVKETSKMPVLARLHIRRASPRGLTFAEQREVTETVLRMAKEAKEEEIAAAKLVELP